MTPGDDRGRPGEERPRKCRTTTATTVPERSPMVSVTVRVDLSNPGEGLDGDRLDRSALFALEDVPSGARVVVWVGDRTWLWDSTAHLLHKAAQRLLLELEGTTRADIRLWLAAVRTGRLEVVA